MQPVTITIDRREVSGRADMTILELARESGINIPTLCHHDRLTPLGACRICLVENEQTGALLAACVATIAPGMVINTASPRVLAHRKMILKLMLASHPDACLVCDKGNGCQLRQLAADLGIGLVELDRIPQPAVIEEVNPFIVRDMSKCILCGRCIRACQELVVEGALDYFGRGFKTKPATLAHAPLENSECTFCGTCVALCPTGALMERETLYRGTVGTAVETICPYCSRGCNISLEIKDGMVVRVRPVQTKLPHAETLCVKGSYGNDFVHNPHRLTVPLLKVNGTFQEVSWEEALAAAAGAFRQIKTQHGPDSLAVLGGANCTNEENYLLQRFARDVLGTNNIDNSSSLDHGATRRAFADSVGLPGITCSMDDLEQADVLVVIGNDPGTSAPLLSYQIKRAVKMHGAKLILIDPRQTKLTNFAECHLRPRIGTDLALLNSLAKIIIDEHLFDQEFVARKTENYVGLADCLTDFPLEWAQAETGVPVGEMRRAARLYGAAAQAAIIFGTGVTRQARGVENVKGLLNLALLTGNIWRRGGGLCTLAKECNAQGAWDMGALPDYLPGCQPVKSQPAREKFARRWQTDLPAAPGLTILETLRQARAGRIRGLYVTGENLVAALPAPAFVREALASLELLVVQDLFLTETARLAGVVLPAASFAEKDGTFTNLEGRVQKVRKAIEPVGQSRPDWQITLKLAEAMGRPWPFLSLQQVKEEMEELVPLYKGDWEEINPEGKEEGFWEKAGRRAPLTRFPSFFCVQYDPPADAPGDSFPFILLAETTPFHPGSGSRSKRSGRLSRFSPPFVVRIGEADALKIGLLPGEQVRVVSPAGQLSAAVEITDTLPRGAVSLPRSLPDRPINSLFSFPGEGEISAPLTCYVRLEKELTS